MLLTAFELSLLGQVCLNFRPWIFWTQESLCLQLKFCHNPTFLWGLCGKTSNLLRSMPYTVPAGGGLLHKSAGSIEPRKRSSCLPVQPKHPPSNPLRKIRGWHPILAPDMPPWSRLSLWDALQTRVSNHMDLQISDERNVSTLCCLFSKSPLARSTAMLKRFLWL